MNICHKRTIRHTPLLKVVVVWWWVSKKKNIIIIFMKRKIYIKNQVLFVFTSKTRWVMRFCFIFLLFFYTIKNIYLCCKTDKKKIVYSFVTSVTKKHSSCCLCKKRFHYSPHNHIEKWNFVFVIMCMICSHNIGMLNIFLFLSNRGWLAHFE